MAVRAGRCEAAGDCRADAHNLAEISPQHLARRLVIYTPTAAEIDELMDKARRDLPEIGANEAVHRVGLAQSRYVLGHRTPRPVQFKKPAR